VATFELVSRLGFSPVFRRRSALAASDFKEQPTAKTTTQPPKPASAGSRCLVGDALRNCSEAERGTRFTEGISPKITKKVLTPIPICCLIVLLKKTQFNIARI
jgi:hypothetical protein